MERLPHRCSDDDPSCICEVHGTPMRYWPAGDDHACQDPDCNYTNGVSAVILSEFTELRRRRRPAWEAW